MNSHTPKLNNRRYIERHPKTGNPEKVSCFFALIFGILKNRQYYAVQRGIERNSLSRLANPQAVRGGAGKVKMKKFPKIPAYSGLCGVVRNKGKFSQISVNFALHGVVGIRGRNIAAVLAKSPLAALKVLTEASTEESATF